jgi:hypothetical protein
MSEPRDRMRERYARSEARNEEIRQSLEPIEPGERPGVVTAGAIIALVLAIANVALTFSGAVDLGDTAKAEQQAKVSAAILSVVLLACAGGMWQARYWAVLGFQALLAIQIIITAGSLLIAPTWWSALVLLALTIAGGWLFWKLVRAMARLQMPQR